MYHLSVQERHRHDCPRCVYRGSTFSAAAVHHDWYTCSEGAGVSLLKRHSSNGGDYHSTDLVGGAYTLVQEAIALGIVAVTIMPETEHAHDQP